MSVHVQGPTAAGVGPEPRVRRAHLGVTTAFVAAGLAFAGLASRIPDVRELLGLSPSELGLLLLAMSTGAVLSLPSSGWLAGRIGAARSVLAGATLLATGLVVAGVGTALPVIGLTAGGLFLVGLGTGTWDVAMNLQGAEVERQLGRTVMPRYHAWFSLGTVAAAGIGALADWARVPVALHLSLTALVAAGAAVAAARRFLPTVAADDARTTAAPRRNPLAAWLGAAHPVGRGGRAGRRVRRGHGQRLALGRDHRRLPHRVLDRGARLCRVRQRDDHRPGVGHRLAGSATAGCRCCGPPSGWPPSAACW